MITDPNTKQLYLTIADQKLGREFHPSDGANLVQVGGKLVRVNRKLSRAKTRIKVKPGVPASFRKPDAHYRPDIDPSKTNHQRNIKRAVSRQRLDA